MYKHQQTWPGSVVVTLAKIGLAAAGLKAVADVAREPRGLVLLYAPSTFLGFTFGVGGEHATWHTPSTHGINHSSSRVGSDSMRAGSESASNAFLSWKHGTIGSAHLCTYLLSLQLF
jgi:hypothetical protein